MDVTESPFDWTRARAALATADEGSLSGAARALRLTQPTVGRQVSALEEELGVTLFTRTGKRMEPTEAGARLIAHFRTMATAARAAALTASAQSRDMTGLVTITASNLYAAYRLPPILRRIRSEAPGLRIEVIASNAVQDIARHEADIAIRHGRPDQPDLTARRVGEDAGALYATPGLLEQGPLHTLPFIGYDDGPAFNDMLIARGIPVAAGQAALMSWDSHAQLAMAREGLGVTAMPTWVGDADPILVRAQPDAPPLVAIPIWLVSHRDLHLSRRIRLVFDLLAEGLAARPRPQT